MDEISERYERITGQFSDRVRAVPPDAWDNPSPCEGWTARDVVGHLVDWISEFFGEQGVTFPPRPSVDEDPLEAWESVRRTLAAAIADPQLRQRPVSTPVATQPLADMVESIVIGDVFMHTWDLARATGQDDTLDPDQLERMVAGIGSMPEDVMRADGMFGPPIEVPPDADDQTRFLAYIGRRA